MACERVCVYAFVACGYTCAVRNRGRWHDEYKWLIVDDDDGDAAADGSGDDGGGGERVRVCAGGDGPVGRGQCFTCDPLSSLSLHSSLSFPISPLRLGLGQG